MVSSLFPKACMDTKGKRRQKITVRRFTKYLQLRLSLNIDYMILFGVRCRIKISVQIVKMTV